MSSACERTSLRGEALEQPADSRGFTLLELLIGISLVAVALLAIASTFPTAYSDVEYGGRRTKAVALAQQKMEELRAGSFPPSTTGSPETIESIYTRSWMVTVTGSPSQVATVTVTVTWPSVLGRKQVTLTSIVAP